MRDLVLIADDLTGALDSCCVFAAPERPVLVAPPWRAIPQGPRVAISTDTRDAPATDDVSDAAARLKRIAGPGALWFKKVDSVMRGEPFAETQAVMEAGGFRRCVFAPAFPAMGRVTAGGRQHVVGDEGVTTPVGPDIIDAFRRLGLKAVIVDFSSASPRHADDAQVLVVEARTQETLRRRVAAMAARLPHDTLWAGAGGLAAALAGEPENRARPPIGHIVVGTRHPVTLEQVERLLAAKGAMEENARPLLIAPSRAAASAEETRQRLAAHIAGIDDADLRAGAVFVTGGDTLSAVLQATDAQFLECVGQVQTGIPLARIRGGRWDGVMLLSKSGGFGAPDFFLDLLR